jgi:hypothetical protein
VGITREINKVDLWLELYICTFVTTWCLVWHGLGGLLALGKVFMRNLETSKFCSFASAIVTHSKQALVSSTIS